MCYAKFTPPTLLMRIAQTAKPERSSVDIFSEAKAGPFLTGLWGNRPVADGVSEASVRPGGQEQARVSEHPSRDGPVGKLDEDARARRWQLRQGVPGERAGGDEGSSAALEPPELMAVGWRGLIRLRGLHVDATCGFVWV